MKFKASIFIVALIFTFGCNSCGNQDDHGHEHGTETHTHEAEEGVHNHEEGNHHHEQEEFIVGEDTTATKEQDEHDHEDGHDHQH